jgi:hypothetical protein
MGRTTSVMKVSSKGRIWLFNGGNPVLGGRRRTPTRWVRWMTALQNAASLPSDGRNPTLTLEWRVTSSEARGRAGSK